MRNLGMFPYNYMVSKLLIGFPTATVGCSIGIGIVRMQYCSLNDLVLHVFIIFPLAPFSENCL